MSILYNKFWRSSLGLEFSDLNGEETETISGTFGYELIEESSLYSEIFVLLVKFNKNK